MRDYELTVLIHPDLEMDLDKALSKVRDIVTTNGGEVVGEDNWGKKRLAYKIAKQDFAVYVQLQVKLPAEGVQKVNNTLNITDEVIRFLLVSVDAKERALRAEAAEAAKKAEKDTE